MDSREAFDNWINDRWHKKLYEDVDEEALASAWKAACQYKDEQYEAVLKRQAGAARMGMDAATKASGAEMKAAQRMAAESSPEALESERKANERLTAEIERLEARIAELEAQRVPEGLLGLLYAVGHHGVQLDEGEFQIGPDEVAKAQELYALLYAPPAPTGDK